MKNSAAVGTSLEGLQHTDLVRSTAPTDKVYLIATTTGMPSLVKIQCYILAANTYIGRRLSVPTLRFSTWPSSRHKYDEIPDVGDVRDRT